MRGSLIKQSGACPPHPSLALLQVTEPQIWGLYHCGQNRGEELSKIRYICGLNLLVRDGQWSRSTMINNIINYQKIPNISDKYQAQNGCINWSCGVTSSLHISSVNTKSGIGHRLILKRMEENGNLQVTVGRQRMPHFSILALISDTFYNKAR